MVKIRHYLVTILQVKRFIKLITSLLHAEANPTVEESTYFIGSAPTATD